MNIPLRKAMEKWNHRKADPASALPAAFDLLAARSRLYELRFREYLMAGLEPEGPAPAARLIPLLLFLTRRALNEICYELKYRPDNVLVPLLGYLDLRSEWRRLWA